MTALIFYLLSFTWGLPITLCGCLAALFAALCRVPCERAGYCLHFRFGHGWGGFSLGVFIFTGREADKKIVWHEHGHGLQNCIFGPFMIFLVSVPSVIRYWYRRLKKDKTRLKPYDDIWFEGQATRMGQRQRIFTALRKKG